ncbi:MAG: biotin--[acetyl-CoA-carboxylase] ligase [Bacillota bacterium]|nr:biotin--[acetyl-CoA-carboxylase] ligase [Bacillota bacterium]
MSVKEEIIKVFEKNRGEYLSGNDIAEALGISRTAVWKNIKNLISEGYRIESAGNRGYVMKTDTDVLSAAGAEKYLKDFEGVIRLEIYDTVTSTNDVLKERAGEGAAEGLAAAAAYQSGGRGRMGRRFESPKNSGLYFSLLLRPEIPLEETTLLTVAAAVAVCRGVESISDIKPVIKWVNDVYVDGKKAAGILTEAAFNGEMNSLDYVIVGIGMNMYLPEGGFKGELRDKAGCFFEKPVEDCRNRLLAAVLKEFWSIYANFSDKSFVDEYRERSFVKGREIVVSGKGISRSAKALDIDSSCRLKVEYDDGTQEYLNSGEISIKPVFKE